MVNIQNILKLNIKRNVNVNTMVYFIDKNVFLLERMAKIVFKKETYVGLYVCISVKVELLKHYFSRYMSY